MATEARTVRNGLKERLDAARAQSDATFAIVRPDAFYDRPIAERHRIIFYVGHLEAFDWNLMASTLFGAPPLDGSLDRLFAFGIDPVNGNLPADKAADWPSPEQVRRYVRRVRDKLDEALQQLDALNEQILDVAVEHRLMHAETLSYMLHWLPLDRKIPPVTSLPPLGRPPAHQMAVVPAGDATLGLPRDGAFGWDNEFDAHSVHVPAFAIDKYPVTNARYLDFVNAGGYSDRSLWTDDNWRWREGADIRHPKFWVWDGRDWALRGMFEEIPLPADSPVYVSHAEASAYARWAGRTLPTEAQWHRAAYGTPEGGERPYPWGDEPPTSRRGNFDFARWDPVSVTAHPQGESAFGVADLLGNGWEWTSTVFGPFQGFAAFPFYKAYSAAFFDGKHYVMKGGSARTARSMLRRSFRNWFQPHYPHIYSTFRCVTAS